MDNTDLPQFQISSRLLSTVKSERVDYIWQSRLAAGMLSLIDGDPGSGKTTVALDLAARITTGEPFPGETVRREPGSVILLSAEDSAEHTLRPRMEAANADLNRVLLVDKRADDDNVTMNITIPDDLYGLEPQIVAANAKLIIIDPIMAYLSGALSANSDQDVRAALAPLMSMANRNGCAVLMIRHMNKSVGSSPMYRGGGSIGIVGAARFAFIAARDPDDPTRQRRVLAPQKINIGPEPPAMAYTLESVPFTDVARVEWHGEVEINADKLLVAQKSEAEQNQIRDAVAWLQDYMRDHSSGVKRKELNAAATSVGIKPSHIDIAVESEKLRFDKDSFGEWVVRYPMGSGPPPDRTNPDTWTEDE